MKLLFIRMLNCKTIGHFCFVSRNKEGGIQTVQTKNSFIKKVRSLLDKSHVFLFLMLLMLNIGMGLMRTWGESETSFYAPQHIIALILFASSSVLTFMQFLYVDISWKRKLTVRSIWILILMLGTLYLMQPIPSILCIALLACLVLEFRISFMLATAVIALVSTSYMLLIYSDTFQMKQLFIASAVLLVQGIRGMLQMNDSKTAVSAGHIICLPYAIGDTAWVRYHHFETQEIDSVEIMVLEAVVTDLEISLRPEGMHTRVYYEIVDCNFLQHIGEVHTVRRWHSADSGMIFHTREDAVAYKGF